MNNGGQQATAFEKGWASYLEEERKEHLFSWETAGIARIYRPPMFIPEGDLGVTVFLAGSIEQDAAARWQDEITRDLLNTDVTLFNPRRNRWDPTWEQRKTNFEFSQQVNWELDALDRSDFIAMNFDPETMSPITLLEFGFYAKSGKLLVCCPVRYQRRGNVEVMCERYGIELHDTYDSWYNAVVEKIKKLQQERLAKTTQ